MENLIDPILEERKKDFKSSLPTNSINLERERYASLLRKSQKKLYIDQKRFTEINSEFCSPEAIKKDQDAIKYFLDNVPNFLTSSTVFLLLYQ